MARISLWLIALVCIGATCLFFLGTTATIPIPPPPPAGGGGAGAGAGVNGAQAPPNDPNVEIREITDYRAPADQAFADLADDRIEDKTAAFDPKATDSRPLSGWRVNASAAVLRLDSPMILPDNEGELPKLRPSYAAAVKAGKGLGLGLILPSVNAIDGKAKQFDDGLYAAIDQAHYQGQAPHFSSYVELVKAIWDKAGPDHPAAPFLAAGLSVAHVEVKATDAAQQAGWRNRFERDAAKSAPIGFYTWNPTLKDCYRFFKFFQHKFNDAQLESPRAIAAVLKRDSGLRQRYSRAVAFYGKLTNPLRSLTVEDLIDADASSSLADLAKKRRGTASESESVAMFPASTSRETELFERLFPVKLPPDADLMAELIKAIRSGQVDLKPRPDSGWYDHQVYALETLLMPERGEEKNKLLLTKSYKKKMLEAFQALITKRRETHARQLDMALPPMSAAPPPLDMPAVGPRLRVEPNPSYYVRTARSYAFLANVLESALGGDALRSLHGLREGNPPQTLDLAAELAMMRDLFYGLYLISSEDIGHKPQFLDGESVDADRVVKIATAWLAKIWDDPDLARDARVCVPVMVEPSRDAIRHWGTLGVRLAKLHVGYARLPKLQPLNDPQSAWRDPQESFAVDYLIPVDEFGEFEAKGRTFNREEFRAFCDGHGTKTEILKALSGE